VPAFELKSGEGDCPFFLEGLFSESTIGATRHELSFSNAMGEFDAGDRDGSTSE